MKFSFKKKEEHVVVAPPEYHHMEAWLEVLGSADYTRREHIKEAQKKGAPHESVYELWEADENDVLQPVGWVQYGDLTSKHMIDSIKSVFEKKGWGTP